MKNWFKKAKNEFMIGWREADEERAAAPERRHATDAIPEVFNKYQSICVSVLQHFKAPFLLIKCVVLTNLFFYLFILLSTVVLIPYFIWKGIATVFSFIF